MIRVKIMEVLAKSPPLKAVQLMAPTGYRLPELHRALQAMVMGEILNRTGNGFYTINTGQHHPYTSPPGVQQDIPRMPAKDRAKRKRTRPEGETRRLIEQILQESPGITLTMIRKRLGLQWGTISYHMNRINADKIIKAENARKQRQPQEETEMATNEEILDDATAMAAKINMPVINLPLLDDPELKRGILDRFANGATPELIVHLEEIREFIRLTEEMREKASE